jgi:hypothetical protein
VRIKEHKYNVTQGLFKKSKLAQHAYEKVHKTCWKEAKVLQIEPNTTYRKYNESTHLSLRDQPISQASLDISPIWTPVITATPSSVDGVGKLRSYVGAIQGICLFSDDFQSDGTLILTTVAVK